MPDPTPEPPDRRCPACGYSMRGLALIMECPECGMSLTPWTDRWRPWYATLGLTFLAWGIPLTVAAFLASHAYLVARNVTDRLEVFVAPTFLWTLLPLSLCLAGLMFLCIACGRWARLAGIVAAFTLVCCTLAAGGVSRLWLSVDIRGDWVLWPTWGRAVPGLLALTGGVVSAALLARVLAVLAREFGVRVRPWAALGAVALMAAVYGTMLADVLHALSADERRAIAPGTVEGTFVNSEPIMAMWSAPYAHAAAGLGLAALLMVVLAVRARVRWEVARPGR